MGVAQRIMQSNVAWIESYISKAKRRIGLHGEPDFTKVQRDRRHGNPHRRIPRNSE